MAYSLLLAEADAPSIECFLGFAKLFDRCPVICTTNHCTCPITIQAKPVSNKNYGLECRLSRVLQCSDYILPMKIKKFAKQFGASIALLSVSVCSFAGSCDQQQVSVLHQKAYVYNEAITNSAIKYRVNPALIKAVITAESCFRNEAKSNKGAGGLMQLIPATAKRFGVNDRFDPAENIDGGTRYLRWLLNRYGGSLPHAIAAYNAGEGRVDRYGANVPIQETAVYTRRVLNAYGKLASNGRNPVKRQAVKPKPIPVAPPVKPKPAKKDDRWKWDEFS